MAPSASIGMSILGGYGVNAKNTLRNAQRWSSRLQVLGHLDRRTIVLPPISFPNSSTGFGTLIVAKPILATSRQME